MPNIYIDASGNPGLITQPGGKPFVVYAAVGMATAESDRMMRTIHKSMVELLPQGQNEFKHSKPNKMNEEFLKELVKQCEFAAFAIVGLRENFENTGYRYPHSCSKWFSRNVLERQRAALRSGRVEIDQGGDVQSDQDLLHYLWNHFDTSKHTAVRDAICVRSEDSPGVQVADLVAGAVRRRMIKGKSSRNKTIQLLGDRLVSIQEFPPKEWESK